MNKKEEQLVSIANKVASHANSENDKFAIDPLTILAIINVIIGLIRIIIECRKNRDQAKGVIRKPGILARLLVRREIRKHFPVEERKCLYNAFLKVSGSLSDKELEDSFDFVEKELQKK